MGMREKPKDIDLLLIEENDTFRSLMVKEVAPVSDNDVYLEATGEKEALDIADDIRKGILASIKTVVLDVTFGNQRDETGALMRLEDRFQVATEIAKALHSADESMTLVMFGYDATVPQKALANQGIDTYAVTIGTEFTAPLPQAVGQSTRVA